MRCIFTWQLVRFTLVPRSIAVVGLVGAVFEIILLPYWLLRNGFKMPDTSAV